MYMHAFNMEHRCTCMLSTWSIGVHACFQHGAQVYMHAFNMEHRCTCMLSTWSTGVHACFQHGAQVYMYAFNMEHRCMLTREHLASCASFREVARLCLSSISEDNCV